MLEKAAAVAQARARIREFADSRRRAVVAGIETSAFAALQTYRFGEGVVEGLTTVFASDYVGGLIEEWLEVQVRLVDPEWEYHRHVRIQANLLDVRDIRTPFERHAAPVAVGRRVRLLR